MCKINKNEAVSGAQWKLPYFVTVPAHPFIRYFIDYLLYTNLTEAEDKKFDLRLPKFKIMCIIITRIFYLLCVNL